MMLIRSRWTLLACILFTAICFLPKDSPAAKAAKDEGPGKIQLMFVQTAKSVEFSNNQMTLKGISPSAIFFSDRPERISGHLTIPAFLKEWDAGKDSFAKDPPNATLSIFSDSGVQYVVVELTNPKLDGENLSYDVRVLEGNPPAKGGISSLFIDWWSVGFGPRPVYGYGYGYGPGPEYCHRNYYTGGVYCSRPGYGYRPPGWYY